MPRKGLFPWEYFLLFAGYLNCFVPTALSSVRATVKAVCVAKRTAIATLSLKAKCSPNRPRLRISASGVANLAHFEVEGT